MSIDDQELERMLGRDLHHRVDSMTGVHLGVDEVRGRARRIRRNRRISAGVGVAAALAIIVPGAMTAGGAPHGTDEIQPAPSPDVTVREVRTTLTLDGLERGDAPAIEYFVPDGVVLPGEGLQPLPESYQALVRSEVHGGWVALGPAGDEVLNLSEDLAVLDRLPSYGFESTPTRDLVAWTVPEPGSQTLVVRSTSDPEEVSSWQFPERPVVEPVGVLGPDSVVYVERGADGEGTVGLANPDGTTTELPYVAARAADPVNGAIAVQTEARGSSGCFGVLDAATRELAWETCDYALGSFSPDGAYVMASAADSDGMGPAAIYVLDAATGDLVAEFASEGRDVVTLLRPAWESAESPAAIVATAVQGDTTTMVRMAVDGSLEEVADPVATSEHPDWYYWLGQDRAGL